MSNKFFRVADFYKIIQHKSTQKRSNKYITDIEKEEPAT